MSTPSWQPQSPQPPQQFYPQPQYAYPPAPRPVNPQPILAGIMALAGVLGVVGASLPYYVVREVLSYTSTRTPEQFAFSGWLTPYSALAAFWMIGAAGVAVLDSGLLPRPKGAADRPYMKYVSLAGFSGAALLAFASSRLYPEMPESVAEDISLTFGAGFWLVMVSAVVGFAVALAAYLMWVREQNPRPAPAQPAAPAPQQWQTTTGPIPPQAGWPPVPDGAQLSPAPGV
jgi:hypothetical protein